MKKLTVILALAATLLVVAGCKGGPPASGPEPSVGSISVMFNSAAPSGTPSCTGNVGATITPSGQVGSGGTRVTQRQDPVAQTATPQSTGEFGTICTFSGGFFAGLAIGTWQAQLLIPPAAPVLCRQPVQVVAGHTTTVTFSSSGGCSSS
jgi:hypothetical protein